MKKLLHNRNLYLVLALILIIAAVLIAGKTMINQKPATLPTVIPTETPVVTEAPVAADEPAVTEAPAATDDPAATEATESTAIPTGADIFAGPGYVYIVADGEARWFELPTTEPGTITLNNDGKINVIRLTSNSVMMESSTCDNQDCVNQGEVTLENLSSRVLYNMILCLPHSVSIELYSQEEMIMMYDAQMATQQ